MTDEETGCTPTDLCSFGSGCDGQGCSTRRRTLLGSLAGGSLAALSGCLGLISAPEIPTSPRVGVDQTFDIEYTEQEETISVHGTEPLLEAGEAQGWELPYFCRTGFCGVCLAQVDGDGHELVDMSINEFDPLDAAAIEDGYVLTCTGRPLADFSIETGLAGALTEEPEDEPEPEEDEEEIDDPEAVRTHPINYVKQQWTIEVREDRTLLNAGEARGFDLPYFCREGWCGQCLARTDGDAHNLVEMRVNNYDPLDDGAISDGYVLTCQGEPRDQFSLETGKHEEEDWPAGSPP